VEIFEAAPDSGWGRKGTWDAVENWTTEADFAHLLDTWNIDRIFECRPIRNIEVYDPQGDCQSITTFGLYLFVGVGAWFFLGRAVRQHNQIPDADVRSI
jgi:hypothetical protein